MIRCKTCVMPETRPDVPFIDGECMACLSFKRRPTIDWNGRMDELRALLAKHDGRCIVGSSGGKDSTYIVLRLIELGAKPTVVTATTCHLTDIGRRNIDNLARYATTIEVSPNKTVRAKLNRLGLEMVGDISWPEHASIFSTPFRMAVALDTPLIFYGENPQDQYGGPMGSDEARQMTRRWTSEYGGFLGLRPADFVGIEGITEHDMADYLLPDDEVMQSIGLEAHFLGQYEQWDSARNAFYSFEHGMGHELPAPSNWWYTENQDNAQTGVHDYFGFLKYGYGRGCAQISVDVRYRRMHRGTAIEWIARNDGLFPSLYMGVSLHEILARIDMTDTRFLELCNQYMNRDLFVEDEVKWGQKLTLRGGV